MMEIFLHLKCKQNFREEDVKARRWSTSRAFYDSIFVSRNFDELCLISKVIFEINFWINSTIEFLYGTRLNGWELKVDESSWAASPTSGGKRSLISFSNRGTKQRSHKKCQLHDRKKLNKWNLLGRIIPCTTFEPFYDSSVKKSFRDISNVERQREELHEDWHDDLNFFLTLFIAQPFHSRLIFSNWTLTNSMFASEGTAECKRSSSLASFGKLRNATICNLICSARK